MRTDNTKIKTNIYHISPNQKKTEALQRSDKLDILLERKRTFLYDERAHSTGSMTLLSIYKLVNLRERVNKLIIIHGGFHTPLSVTPKRRKKNPGRSRKAHDHDSSVSANRFIGTLYPNNAEYAFFSGPRGMLKAGQKACEHSINAEINIKRNLNLI